MYWAAYLEVATDRPSNTSQVAPIPFSAICNYADRYGFYDEDFEDLRNFIRVLDNVFIEYYREESASTPKTKGKKQKQKGKVIF